ncbi:MAG: hypothetical protein JO061_23960 [Acidobacteriaceae bacterium]|nr:hypothetical protein [Acidobacteriaceae bacterium]
MPDQREHERPEDMVESSAELEKEAARTLEDSVDSHATLEGYYAMNNKKPNEQLEEDAAKDREDQSGKRAKGHRVP